MTIRSRLPKWFLFFAPNHCPPTDALCLLEYVEHKTIEVDRNDFYILGTRRASRLKTSDDKKERKREGQWY